MTGEWMLRAGLVHLVHFNGNSNDSSINAYNGTDTTITYPGGKFGSAAGSFNGSSSSITFGAAANTKNSVFTYACWINPLTSGSGNRTMKSHGTANAPGFRLITGDKFALSIETVGNVAQSVNSVPLGVWTFLAITYNASGNYVYYINGKIDSSGTNLQSWSFGNLVFGKNGTQNSEFFGGLMDEFAQFSTVLTDKQIKDYYSWSVGRFTKVV